jgi:hypothetical protein
LGCPGGPFFLTAPDLFRRPGPPWLSSRTWARVFAETRLLGGAASTLRTPAPTETARLWSDPPIVQDQRGYAARPPGSA